MTREKTAASDLVERESGGFSDKSVKPEANIGESAARPCQAAIAPTVI
jgi:hypothetical protein